MAKTLFYIALLLVLISCDKTGLFDGGPTTTREIDLNDTFNLIEIENIFNITLVQDTVYKILVTCGENLQKFVDISIVNKVLHINQQTEYDWSRPYQKINLEFHIVRLPAINIRQPIQLISKGTLSVPDFVVTDWGKFSQINVDLNVENCQLAMTSDNFGYYQLKGTCSYANLWGWGSCTVRADSLIAEKCNVLQRGWGNVYVNFTSQLKVSVESSGNIYYVGNPNDIVIDKLEGGGKLIPLN